MEQEAHPSPGVIRALIEALRPILYCIMNLIMFMEVGVIWTFYDEIHLLNSILKPVEEALRSRLQEVRLGVKEKVRRVRNNIKFRADIEVIFTHIFGHHSWNCHWAKRITALYGLRDRQIYAWRKKWERDHEWRPWHYSSGIRWGRRVFSLREELLVVDHINECYIDAGIQCTYEAVRSLFMIVRDICHPGSTMKCSDPWIRDFMQRHDFVIRRPTVARRRPADAADRDCFVARLNVLAGDVDPHRIVNVDETCWWFYLTGLSQWAKRGAPCVKLHHDGNEKLNVTAVCAATAAGDKLPVWVIAKGKTRRCEAGLDAQGVEVTHTMSGWTTETSFADWLLWLREELYQDDDPIYVVLDLYSVHRSEATKRLAARLNIELLFIPPGQTGELQPLDRTIFGAMKQIGRGLYRRRMEAKRVAGEAMKITKEDAAEILSEAWARVSDATLESAWSIYDLNTDAFLWKGGDGDLDPAQVIAEMNETRAQLERELLADAAEDELAEAEAAALGDIDEAELDDAAALDEDEDDDPDETPEGEEEQDDTYDTE